SMTMSEFQSTASSPSGAGATASDPPGNGCSNASPVILRTTSASATNTADSPPVTAGTVASAVAGPPAVANGPEATVISVSGGAGWAGGGGSRRNARTGSPTTPASDLSALRSWRKSASANSRFFSTVTRIADWGVMPSSTVAATDWNCATVRSGQSTDSGR